MCRELIVLRLCVLKVADGIYQHVDVREEGKENAFSLGHTLWINNEVRTHLFPASSGAHQTRTYSISGNLLLGLLLFLIRVRF